MIRQRLAAYVEARVQEIIVRFVDATQLESVRLLTIKLLISGKCRTIGYERHRMFCCSLELIFIFMIGFVASLLFEFFLIVL